MSAWIVSKKHIDVMITFALIREIIPQSQANEAGKMLWEQNYRSVNTRYQENTHCPRYIFSQVDRPELQKEVVIIKACHCYDYQSCETGDYDETPAALLSQKIRETAKQAYSKYKDDDNIPGYEAAPWGID